MALNIPQRTSTKTGLIIPPRITPVLEFGESKAKDLIQGMLDTGQATIPTEPITIPPRQKPNKFFDKIKDFLKKPFRPIDEKVMGEKGLKGLTRIPQKDDTPLVEAGKWLEEKAKGYEPIGDKLFEELSTKEKAKAFSKEYTKGITRLPQVFTSGQLLGISGGLGYLERFGWDTSKSIADKTEDWARQIAPEDPNLADSFVSAVGSMSLFYVPGSLVAKGTSLIAGISPKIASLVGNSVMTFIESSMEAGGVYRDNIQQGNSVEEAKRNADIDFGINVALLALTNKFDFTGATQKSLVKEIKNRLMTGAREAAQEFGQQIAGNLTTYKNWDEGIKEAGLMGGLIGFLFGGGVNPSININVETQKEIIDLVNEAKKSEAGFTKLPPKPTLSEIFKDETKAIPDELAKEVVPSKLFRVGKAGDVKGKFFFTKESVAKGFRRSDEPIQEVFLTRELNPKEILTGESQFSVYRRLFPDTIKSEFIKQEMAMPAGGLRDVRKYSGDTVKNFIRRTVKKTDIFTREGRFDFVAQLDKEIKDVAQKKGIKAIKYTNPNEMKWFKTLKGQEEIAILDDSLVKATKAVKGVEPAPYLKEIEKEITKKITRKAPVIKEKIKGEKRIEKIKLTSKEKRGNILDKIKTEKGTTQAVKEDIVNYAKENLELRERGKLLATVKNVKTFKDLDKAKLYIEKLSEEADKRTFIKEIQKEIKATIAKGKTPKGKYTPEVQNVLNSIKKLVGLNQKQANKKLENNLKEYAVKMPVEVAMENYILSLYTGTSAQKQELLNIIKQLKEKGEVASALKKFNIQADIQRKSNLVVDRVTGGQGIEQGRLQGQPADKTKIQKVKQYLKAVGKKTVLDWRGLMATLDFNSSVKTKPLADFFSVSKNESKYKELQSKYREAFDVAISDIYKIKNKPNSILKVVNKIATEKIKVDKYEMTRDELIKRYMEIQDPTLIDSFKQGNKYTDNTFEEIENKISEQDKVFAEWQLDYYKKIYKNVNEVYSEMNGIDLPFNELYSPIRRVGYKVEPGHTEFMDEAFYRKAVTDKSLISRVKNLNPILKQGSLSVLDKHITDINYYIAWAKKIRELDSIFTNNEVREAIKQEFPDSILEAVNNKIQHIATHGNKTASRVGWVDRLRKSYVIGNLAVKPALTVKQLVSTLAYAEKIKAHELAIGILDFAKNPIKNFNILKNESAFIKMRGLGMERDIRDAIKEGVFSRYKKQQNLANTLLLNVKLGDKGAIVLGSWAMRKARLKAGVPLEDVINEYEEFSADTQQSADISRLSEIQLGGSIEKLFTVFKSTQRAYFQKEVNAVKSMFRKDGFGKENIRKVARTLFIYHLLLPVIFQFVANMGGWDEEDKKEYKRAMILGSINGLFIAGDMIDGIIRQVMGLRVWDTEVIIADIGDDIVKIISNLTEDDVSTEDVQTALDAFASASTGLTGLPVEYSYDILESLYNENYETGMKQILGWSEYVIDKPKKKKIKGERKSLEAIFNKEKTEKRKSLENIFE